MTKRLTFRWKIWLWPEIWFIAYYSEFVMLVRNKGRLTRLLEIPR